jgi:hypothetical protein
LARPIEQRIRANPFQQLPILLEALRVFGEIGLLPN